MNRPSHSSTKELTEHFFRNEYGKIVSVVTRYLGVNNVETAEDIVQETLLKAVDYWEQNGIPENPQAWLYKAAKNLTINILKRRDHLDKYEASLDSEPDQFEQIQFSEEIISDEQLKMMFACCHHSISERTQIALILKILCGFSITEISNAFFSNNETVNKQLVRGRKQLRENKMSLDISDEVNDQLNVVLKTIYLLFNEGYSPTKRNELIRFDLCLEAIRLLEIIVANKEVKEKSDSYALLALMYLNASRFKARMNEDNSIIEMEKQDRSKWNQDLIQTGTHFLNMAMKENRISLYLILATISANHCIAKSYEATNWKEILRLYDDLLRLEDSPTARLNRSVALAMTEGIQIAIQELKSLQMNSDIGKHYLFHATLGEFYKREKNLVKAVEHLTKAIDLSENERDSKLLEKKMKGLVPIS
jgi:RNA polymerase sigma factor (sigma-70 family)